MTWASCPSDFKDKISTRKQFNSFKFVHSVHITSEAHINATYHSSNTTALPFGEYLVLTNSDMPRYSQNVPGKHFKKRSSKCQEAFSISFAEIAQQLMLPLAFYHDASAFRS